LQLFCRDQAMSNQYDDVRPLRRDQVSHPRRYARPAKVIPFDRHPHDHRLLWQVAGSSFLAIATAFLLIAMLVIASRAGNDVLFRLAPGWPWW
jgi:hypothetical protein